MAENKKNVKNLYLIVAIKEEKAEVNFDYFHPDMKPYIHKYTEDCFKVVTTQFSEKDAKKWVQSNNNSGHYVIMKVKTL